MGPMRKRRTHPDQSWTWVRSGPSVGQVGLDDRVGSGRLGHKILHLGWVGWVGSSVKNN